MFAFRMIVNVSHGGTAVRSGLGEINKIDRFVAEAIDCMCKHKFLCAWTSSCVQVQVPYARTSSCVRGQVT